MSLVRFQRRGSGVRDSECGRRDADVGVEACSRGRSPSRRSGAADDSGEASGAWLAARIRETCVWMDNGGGGESHGLPGVGAVPESRETAERRGGASRGSAVLSPLPKLRAGPKRSRGDRRRRSLARGHRGAVAAHDTHVLTVRQGWPQHRVATWCSCLAAALGQKRGSLIASPSPCHTCSSGARCRGVSPSSSRCRPSRSYLHAPGTRPTPSDPDTYLHCRA